MKAGRWVVAACRCLATRVRRAYLAFIAPVDPPERAAEPDARPIDRQKMKAFAAGVAEGGAASVPATAATLRHQTKAEFLARFRKRYSQATGEEALRLGAWLSAHQGGFTPVELRAAWGLAAADLAAFTARLRAQADAHRALTEARSE